MGGREGGTGCKKARRPPLGSALGELRGSRAGWTRLRREHLGEPHIRDVLPHNVANRLQPRRDAREEA
eukprot:709978-Prymnesium_polylepis.2